MSYLPDYQIAIAAAVILLGMVFLFSIASEHQDTGDKRLARKCVSKSSGSQPECWDEEDWKAFCFNTNICNPK